MIKTAIIPVAGYGSRRLPASKAIEKCMLPIGNRPGIDFLLEDCKKAGLQRVIFVVNHEDNGEQLRNYLGVRLDLDGYLRNAKKTNELALINGTTRGMKIEYVRQDPAHGYGTAIPVWECADLVKDEDAVVVMMGDDIIFRRDGGSDLADLIADYETKSPRHAMLTTEIPQHEVSKYGVLALTGEFLTGFVEKPKPDEAPSGLINISKYIFGKSFFAELDSYMRTPVEPGKERYITDVIIGLVERGEKILVKKIAGRYLDNGTEQGSYQAWKVIVGGEE